MKTDYKFLDSPDEGECVTATSTYAIYAEYARKKAERKEKARREKKKKKKDHPIPMEPCEEIEEYPPFRPEILSPESRSFPEIKWSVNDYVAHREG